MTDVARLIVQNIPRLRRYARALTGDDNRADDLVQDCLERAWSRIKLWRQDDDIRAWLFTIMHNIFANLARRHSREPVFLPLPDEDSHGADQPLHDYALNLRDLKRALDALPEDQREVILLIGLEQLSYQEAAHVLGIPTGTVMSRLSRGRERLRRYLQDPPKSRIRRIK